MKTDDIEPFLHALCEVAAKQTLPRFRNLTDVHNKLDADFDPVTEADRAAEAAIRDLIGQTYPDHSVIGEEYGSQDTASEFQWIIDPIDGTRAYISGLPVWGTLIGLYHKGVPLAGMMHQPYTDERFFCSGKGSFFSRANSTPISIATRKTGSLSEATLMTTSPAIMEAGDRAIFDRVEAECLLSRYGCDCYAYAMLAAGQIDMVMETGLNIYDIAALIPIIEQAGGVVTDWQGGKAHQGGNILAVANASLHEAALKLIAK